MKSIHTVTPLNRKELCETAIQLFRQKNFDESEYILRRLAAAFPFDQIILNYLGTVLDSKGKYLEAASYYSKAITLDDGFITAEYNLANSLKKGGMVSEAKRTLLDVVKKDPDFKLAWQNLASIWFDEGNLVESACCLEKVIKLDPTDVIALGELGDIYEKTGEESDKAIECIERFIWLKPDAASAYNTKGLILHEMEQFPEAVCHFKAALSLEPDDHFYMNNLGLSLLAEGNVDEALIWFNKSLGSADSPTTRFNRAIANLSTGNYSDGWRDFESRFSKIDPVYLPPLDIERWRGEDLTDKSIIVRMEQGYGDNIQCLRFIPMLSIKAKKVFLECIDDNIMSLAKQFEPICNLFLRSDPTPAADYQVPIFSLPLYLNVDFNNLPFSTGYLKPDILLSKYWGDEINNVCSKGSIKVGLAWGGRKTRLNATRSIPFENLSPLFDINGISWFSLQLPDDSQKSYANEKLHDFTDRFCSFSDTGAFISNLDLVICIDTSIAHLAGAMGKPVWIMLRSYPDWRWMRERDDSSWYYSAKLYRQKRPKEWNGVIEKISAELKQMAEKNIKDSPCNSDKNS